MLPLDPTLPRRLPLFPAAAIEVLAGAAYVNPVVAVVLGTLVLGEPPSPGVLLGGGLILGSSRPPATEATEGA